MTFTKTAKMTMKNHALLAVVVFMWLSLSLEMEGVPLCINSVSGTQHCNHNQSHLCYPGINTTVSCLHQLSQEEIMTAAASEQTCLLEKFYEACGSLQPWRVYDQNKPLVQMKLYHYNTWIGQHATVNFTFPSPDWNELKFQYKSNWSQEALCRQFILRGVSFPRVSSLMYDCVTFGMAGNVTWDAELTVLNDRGEGRTYIFTVPHQARINPWVTVLSEWHVFFYVHQNFIATSSHLPVTIQSAAPFPAISYNVSLVKCNDVGNLNCNQYSVLHYLLVTDPQDDEWTVKLPIWANPGSYAVTVQIVSGDCPSETGCYVSMSPRFEIKRSLMSVWVTMVIAFFLIAFLTFLLMFNHRLTTNKKILVALRDIQPRVLLVYSPQHQTHLNFIKLFAQYLKESCHLLPCFVDRDVGIKDPNCWTRDHICEADKVLFIVPGEANGESITPIRNQWRVALNYLSGHHSTSRKMTNKVAAVILPSSGNIPSEILHARRFKLVDEVVRLITWLHDGTWLDQVFLWQPQVKSSLTGWQIVMDSVVKTLPITGTVPQMQTSCSELHKKIFVTGTDELLGLMADKASLQSEELSDNADIDSELSACALDPDIPSIERMDIEQECESSASHPSLNYETDSSHDNIFT